MLFKEIRKDKINPESKHLSDFIEKIPDIFESEGKTIHDGRNKIKVFEVDGSLINVKRYRVPLYFFNRFVYYFFRKPKARRAYENALRLLDEGFVTPKPIAYTYFRTSCLLNFSYFVSSHVEYKYNIGYIELKKFDEEAAFVWRELAIYTAQLHEKGILHLDYGSGNVMYNIEDGKCNFILYDINRMKFGPVSLEVGCKNFERLLIHKEAVDIIAQAYAEVRGFDKDTVKELILKTKGVNRIVDRK